MYIDKASKSLEKIPADFYTWVISLGAKGYDGTRGEKNRYMNASARLSASEQAQKRQDLARYTEEDLKGMTVTRLRELAVGIVPNVAKMRKTQIVTELLAATQAERVIVALVPDTPVEAIAASQALVKEFRKDVNKALGDLAQKIYMEFRTLVQSRIKDDGTWDEKIYGDLASLANRVVYWLNTHKGLQKENNYKLDYTTKLRYRTHIVNLLTEQLNTEQGSLYFKQLESCLDYFKRQIRIQLSDLTVQKQNDGKLGIAKRKESKAQISFKPLHDFAVTVLSSLDKLKPSQWKAVSVSLAITSGRRMAEIHLSSTQFELVDNRHVMFTGQLKAKGTAAEYFSKNPAYEIPTLVDAELVVLAHEWLKSNGKVVDNPERADRRYAKDLSDFLKAIRKQWEVKHEFFTYKGFRSIYALTCNQVFNNGNPDNALYLARILGHGRGELGELGKIVDLVTPQSYNSDFEVVDWECAKP